jgi:PHS family inorganic phosphate transporter-like MFS transporter
MLTLGAVPAAAVIYLRRKMPESPRYHVQVQGRAGQAARPLTLFTGGQVSGQAADGRGAVMGSPSSLPSSW